ncbi:MAG: proline--tRNA ligase [Deltaproteobacteria bacterium]|nr:proline--tRNA ligase [Deltaproteobacteria bacterium]
MRFSQLLIPTLKENPAEAEIVSHQLMVRAGLIRKLAAGIYSLLPLGLRVIRKVEGIVREELARAGAQEVELPVVVPAELWQESGRWEVYGKELLRLRDRHEREFCLGPTHEEVITDIIRREVRSYRQLPMNLFQIHTKFRDEIRPRFGLMRGREFTMMDAYSFHADGADLDREYEVMRGAYERIFRRCGLSHAVVEADTGAIGGKDSHEFMVLADSGEDAIASCPGCGYAANVEKAEVKAAALERVGEGAVPPLEKVATPGKRTIEEVSAFLRIPPSRFIKTLIYRSDAGLAMVLIRGDLQVNDLKLRRHLGAEVLEMASDSEIEAALGAPVGFVGPARQKGFKGTVLADTSIRSVGDGVTGANEPDAHLLHVEPGRDFTPDDFADLRMASPGDACARCGAALEFRRGIEVGHIFKLGTKYSEAMRATYLDEEGAEQVIVMGTYGIGIGRTAAAAIEQNHDKNGIIWPAAIAPFGVTVLPLQPDQEVVEAAAQITEHLESAGAEVLLDDRDERAGVKFADADLIGCPVRIIVGKKSLAGGMVEIGSRQSAEKTQVALGDAAERALDALRAALAGEGA